jgi:hypothetical protein
MPLLGCCIAICRRNFAAGLLQFLLARREPSYAGLHGCDADDSE